MTGLTEQQEAPAATASTAQPSHVEKAAPTSPAHSDKSSDSEGKPVREKLKETRIDAQAASESKSNSDKHMKDGPNGSADARDQSTSGSDSDRGRLRRKRSREDFEDDHEADKQPEKKQEKEKERHHRRKRSRDVKDIESGAPLKAPAASVTRIEEHDGDEHMTTPSKDSSKAAPVGDSSMADTSPKNKRTRDQAEDDTTAAGDAAKDAVANGKPVSKSEDERDSKRPRDKADEEPAAKAKEATTKIPPGSGFSNTSAASPFAAMAAKPSTPKATDKREQLPQTSDDKFKASGFGSFASSAASPFGGLAGSGSKSPFAAPSGGKLSSFGGSIGSSAAPTSGFGALANSNKSAFGGSTFGGALGGGFGALNGAKPGLSSFATPSDLTIKGLKAKATAFGTPGEADRDEGSGDEDGDDDDNEKDAEEGRSSQPFLSQQPHETGEEGETTIWVGRAKLYVMSGEGTTRGWKERGVGNFKFNITVDEPKKARFVLRADGTHRLLLNTAVTKKLAFGGDSTGEKPKDGKLVFNSPNAEGELEMHLLRLKSERAVELWEEVSKIQESEL